MDSLQQIAVLALAVSAISITITRGSIFSQQRRWLVNHSRWLGKLVSCPYCLSHWVSGVFVAIYQPVVLVVWKPLDLVVAVFIMVAISAIITGIITNLLHFEAEGEEVDALYDALTEAKKVISGLVETIKGDG